MGDCLEDVPICSDVADGPLTQAGTAQPENVTKNTQRRRKLQLGADRKDEMTSRQPLSGHIETANKISRNNLMICSRFPQLTPRQFKGELCNMIQNEERIQALASR